MVLWSDWKMVGVAPEKTTVKQEVESQEQTVEIQVQFTQPDGLAGYIFQEPI